VSADDRALSSTVSYVLAVGITAVLVTSLVFAMGGFLEDESERATRQQLESLGARLADDVAAADRYSRVGGNVTVEADAPERVVGNSYTIELGSGSECDSPRFTGDHCLVLETAGGGVTVRQPLENRSALSIEGGPGSGLEITVRGDGTVGRGTYAEPPDVPATVGVGDISGAGTVGTVVGNTDPIAGFIFSPGDPVTGTNVTFRNDTDDVDGIIASYEWSFELPSGGNATRTGRTANFTYDTPGVYTVTLEVTDDDGETDSVKREVPVGGLVYRDDANGSIDYDGDDRPGGVRLSFNNTWGSEAEILTLGIDPDASTSDVERLENDDGGDEIRFDAPPSGEDGRYTGTLEFPEDGVIVDIDAESGDGGAVVGAGDVVTLELSELATGPDDNDDLDDADDHPLDLAVRYRVDGAVYVTKVTVFDLDDGPTVTWGSADDWDAATSRVNVTRSGDEMRLDAPGTGGLPTADMRVWLPLNESGSPTDAWDYAGGTAYEFEVRGDPTTGVTGFDGGDAYRFDGDDDWLLDGNAETTYLGSEESLTVSMWVRADSTGTDAGLLDTSDDGGDGQDDEFGLRYDSSGYEGGATDTFKSSIAVDEGYREAYAYEYESGAQSTGWQHVALRWESGERIGLFVNGTALGYTGSTGVPPGGAPMTAVDFLTVGRSQKDDTDALWEGRIDEVRIYDRTLSESEIGALASNTGLRRGSFNTTWKTTSRNLDLSDLRLGYDAERNGGTVEVTVYARRDDGSVHVSDRVLLSGDSGVKEVEGLTGGTDEFRLHVEFAGASNTPSADEFTLGD
jgi:hypothetical protein